MASVLLRNVTRAGLGRCLKGCRIILSNERCIMTSRARLEKVLEELQRNPYYDKYAEKIAKLQQTSPEEFLQRVEQQEKKAREKQVKHVIPKYQPSNSAIFPFLFKNVRSSWSQTIKRQYVKDLSQTKYITTPIFYVNAGPHIGHLYSAVLADAFVRYNGMLGHKTFFATGTDEHGNKIKAAAAIAGLPNLEYCTKISQQFREMCDKFEVDYSRFIRTTEKQHCDAVIGKDILKFHGIYWPAFLMAAGLEPPKTLLCHAHWTIDHQKMSKSKGNVISPFEAANDYTEEGLRYFILREAVPQNDANYSSTKIINILNSELADTLGNLVNRCAGKAVNPSKEFPDPAKYWNVLQSQVADETREALKSVGEKARDSYEEYNLHHVVDAVMSMLHCANKMVAYHEPWQLRKQVDDADSIEELKAVISLALESSRIGALILYPIVPKLSSSLLDFLNIPKENRMWTDTVPDFFNNSLKERYIERNNLILFKKIRN
ncbi:hypothetical protein P5V15_005592 [Pogonomyrmex californicus]